MLSQKIIVENVVYLHDRVRATVIDAEENYEAE